MYSDYFIRSLTPQSSNSFLLGSARSKQNTPSRRSNSLEDHIYFGAFRVNTTGVVGIFIYIKRLFF